MSGLVYVHPVAGATAVALMVAVAILGLRARHPKPYAPRSRQLHRRLAPLAYAAFVVLVGAGPASVHWLRSDLELADSRHFAFGFGAVATFTAAALASRWLARSELAKIAHPILGMLGVALALALGVTGMNLLP